MNAARVVKALRCPAEGRVVARLEVDPDGSVWLDIMGGKRGDLARDREWEDAKGRASFLGVLDPVTGEQVAWDLPSAASPSAVEPYRMPLPGPEEVRKLSEPPFPGGPNLLAATFKVPIRAVCPRCHRVAGVRLAVSDGGRWSAVLE